MSYCTILWVGVLDKHTCQRMVYWKIDSHLCTCPVKIHLQEYKGCLIFLCCAVYAFTSMYIHGRHYYWKYSVNTWLLLCVRGVDYIVFCNDACTGRCGGG